MEVSGAFCVPVTEETQVGDARRQVVRLAERQGMSETDVARAALVATELAGNLVKHTPRGGEVLVRSLQRGSVPGVELLVLDRGPGIEDLARSLRDGYSTAGSPGTGLGAVSRLADLFQVHSTPGAGTVLLAHVWGAGAAGAAGVELGAVHQPKPGEAVNGDCWGCRRRGGELVVLVADGLGHGAGAAAASREVARVFRERDASPPEEALQAMHGALRATRGAAVAVAVLDPAAGTVRYAGVGNIAGVVLHGAESRSLVSHNGIVGHGMRRVQEYSYPWPPGALLVLHSDGIASRWDLGRYPGLAARHPALIAGVLYRDHARGTDDATVVVVRRPA